MRQCDERTCGREAVREQLSPSRHPSLQQHPLTGWVCGRLCPHPVLYYGSARFDFRSELFLHHIQQASRLRLGLLRLH